jgi:DNA-binding CsgD family transcriptional regulator
MSLDTAYRPWVPALPVPRDLTPRETDVLEAAARGLSSGATARFLGLREGTVRTHRRNIRRQFQVHTTAAAVATAMRKGLIQ